MEIKGMKGLHQICREKSAGLSLPDDTGVGEDVRVILTVDPNTTKAELRSMLMNMNPSDALAVSKAVIELHKDLT